MIRDILVHVDGRPAGQHRAAFAAALAVRHGARLAGLHVTAPADVPPLYRPSLVEDAAAALEARAAAAAAAAEAGFRAAVAGRPVEAAWTTVAGAPAEVIAAAGAAADLLVLGGYEAAGSAERHPMSLAESVAAAAGRPVLAVPEAAAIEGAGLRRALLAWDASRAAVRALHDALPLLRRARARLEVVSLGAAAEEGLGALLAHLGRHRIALAAAKEGRRPPREALAERLRAGHFDLLVMGMLEQPAWIALLLGSDRPGAILQAGTPVLISR